MLFSILSSGIVDRVTDWMASRLFTGPLTRYLATAAAMLLLADGLCVAISLKALLHSHDPHSSGSTKSKPA
jgi:hypothetical protein